jgi:hypothetical protein
VTPGGAAWVEVSAKRDWQAAGLSPVDQVAEVEGEAGPAGDAGSQDSRTARSDRRRRHRRRELPCPRPSRLLGPYGLLLCLIPI